MGDHVGAMPPLRFEKYSFDRLTLLLREFGRNPDLRRERHLHLIYFEEYFKYFLAKGEVTIVTERKYTDRDYLEDFAAYYVRCFGDKYPAICARLHFFQGKLGEEHFRSATTGEDLNNRYLGFIVVRPLPHACIGRTCLKTYNHDGHRYYPVTRPCKAHLLGFELAVDSLPFQQQDKAAAACATSAIWSALQGTAMLFQHRVYSPVEITRIATSQFPGLRRAFPNKGLNPTQMCAAVREAGLEPEMIGVESEPSLQSTAYAYLRARIPILLNVALFDFSDGMVPEPYNRDWNLGHAVAITGYSLGRCQTTPLPESGTLLRATRIDKLYVHDDQLGPFARLEFGGPTGLVKFDGEERELGFSLRSFWPGRGGQLGDVCFAPWTLVIPVYHKIRVDFDTILQSVIRYEGKLRKKSNLDLPALGVEWDIRLTTAAEFKADIRSQELVNDEVKWAVLSKPYPRFLWIASACFQTSPMIDLIFDATDVPVSSSLLIDELVHGTK